MPYRFKTKGLNNSFTREKFDKALKVNPHGVGIQIQKFLNLLLKGKVRSWSVIF